MQGLRPGKLPDPLLERLLRCSVQQDHPRLLAGPAPGLDVAVLDFGDRRLVWKSDPISFATDAAGWYAVVVNANDIATSGADPLSFQATILLPEGFREEAVEDLFSSIRSACDAIHCIWSGGHTEVTAGLRRPIVCGSMMGELLAGRRLLLASMAKPEDELLLVGPAAVEGTAIIARERGAEAMERGVSAETVRRGRDFLYDPGISVLPAARIVRDYPIHALHDPTEGGVLRGALELARASACGLLLDRAAVSLREETRRLCAAFDLDPLATIASGALLVACPPGLARELCGILDTAGLDVACIGRLTAGPQLRIRDTDGEIRSLDASPVDEITKLFAAGSPAE